MGREWTTRSFKSGNSVALRVPASVGIAAGEQWRLVEDGDGFRLEKCAAAKRKFNIAKVAGSARDLQFIKDEDRRFDERSLIWPSPTGTQQEPE